MTLSSVSPAQRENVLGEAFTGNASELTCPKPVIHSISRFLFRDCKVSFIPATDLLDSFWYSRSIFLQLLHAKERICVCFRMRNGDCFVTQSVKDGCTFCQFAVASRYICNVSVCAAGHGEELDPQGAMISRLCLIVRALNEPVARTLRWHRVSINSPNIFCRKNRLSSSVVANKV